MKLTIDMPQVTKCSVAKCAYNVDQACHARAITVGDAANARCDTYFDGPTAHIRETKRVAGVGACKVSVCRYNDDFECIASGVSVDYSQNAAICHTFSPRL